MAKIQIEFDTAVPCSLVVRVDGGPVGMLTSVFLSQKTSAMHPYFSVGLPGVDDMPVGSPARAVLEETLERLKAVPGLQLERHADTMPGGLEAQSSPEAS